jgi:hypothetical protein
VTLGRTFYRIVFKQKVTAAKVIAIFCNFVRNIIKKCINYPTIICVNDNNAVINNDYERKKRSYFVLKNFHGDAKGFFFEICRQFRHAPSKRFSSSGIDFGRISYWIRIRKLVGCNCLKHSAKMMNEEVEVGVDPRILNLDTKMRELSAPPPPQPTQPLNKTLRVSQSMRAAEKREISAFPAIELSFPDHATHNLFTYLVAERPDSFQPKVRKETRRLVLTCCHNMLPLYLLFWFPPDAVPLTYISQDVFIPYI